MTGLLAHSAGSLQSQASPLAGVERTLAGTRATDVNDPKPNACAKCNVAQTGRGCIASRLTGWIGGDMMFGGIGRLVVITGLPGSGKTTLAIRFAGSLPACR